MSLSRAPQGLAGDPGPAIFPRNGDKGKKRSKGKKKKKADAIARKHNGKRKLARANFQLQQKAKRARKEKSVVVSMLKSTLEDAQRQWERSRKKQAIDYEKKLARQEENAAFHRLQDQKDFMAQLQRQQGEGLQQGEESRRM